MTKTVEKGLLISSIVVIICGSYAIIYAVAHYAAYGVGKLILRIREK